MKSTQTIRPLFVVVENFLSTLDSLGLTNEKTVPTERLIHVLAELGHEFPEDEYE